MIDELLEGSEDINLLADTSMNMEGGSDDGKGGEDSMDEEGGDNSLDEEDEEEDKFDEEEDEFDEEEEFDKDEEEVGDGKLLIAKF
jgi:hypothetical protein